MLEELEATAGDAGAVAAADDFTARLLRLDQGVEAILDAVKRCSADPDLQLLPRHSGCTARPTARSKAPARISPRARPWR